MTNHLYVEMVKGKQKILLLINFSLKYIKIIQSISTKMIIHI